MEFRLRQGSEKAEVLAAFAAHKDEVTAGYIASPAEAAVTPRYATANWTELAIGGDASRT